MSLNKKFLSSILAGCVSLLPMNFCRASTSSETDLAEILESEPYFADNESSQDSEEQIESSEAIRIYRVQELFHIYMRDLIDLEFCSGKLKELVEQKNKTQLFYINLLAEIELILNKGQQFIQCFNPVVFCEERLNPVEFYEFIEDLKGRSQEVSRALYAAVDEIERLNGKKHQKRDSILELQEDEMSTKLPGYFFDDNGFKYYI